LIVYKIKLLNASDRKFSSAENGDVFVILTVSKRVHNNREEGDIMESIRGSHQLFTVKVSFWCASAVVIYVKHNSAIRMPKTQRGFCKVKAQQFQHLLNNF
jgi:hypothetical protein